VVDKEIALIRERQARQEYVHFYPLLLTPTPKNALEQVLDKNLRPRDAKPFSDYSTNDRYRHMSDAADEIADISRKIARRKRSPRQRLGRRRRLEVEDAGSLEEWLAWQNPEATVALAVRAALRAAPSGMMHAGPHIIADLAGIVFRASALAWVSAKYPTLAGEFRAVAITSAELAASAADVAQGAADAIARAASAAVRAAADSASALADRAARAAAVDAAVDAVTASADAAYETAAGDEAADDVWEEIRADALAMEEQDAYRLADLPLWSRGIPPWASDDWKSLKSLLPRNEGWKVWIDWYDQRLHGASQSESYELVFASVPRNLWDKGAVAANAWIREHLPKLRKTSVQANLPSALPGLAAPFTYGWTASLRVAVVAGAQNLPYYPSFKSEEDHRHALEACRLGGERLLKALRDGRYNARKEYGEALEYYLHDLPKTAGEGNILLADDQVRILHDMFLADAAMLPEGFASRLKSVIANQFALNAFYDLVQRHNEAVSAGNWTQPFPLDEAKSFFGAIEGNTPHWFEPQVERGLRQVEDAVPPPAPAPSEVAATSVIQPPPLPPGAPDAGRSHERQMATAANALWETFLQGRDMPVAQDEWRAAAEELGAHVRPILDFLRAQQRGKKQGGISRHAPRRPSRA
jgi:hypothetical protein